MYSVKVRKGVMGGASRGMGGASRGMGGASGGMGGASRGMGGAHTRARAFMHTQTDMFLTTTQSVHLCLT